MRKVIYRRDNISVALDGEKEITGCNLWIWYGYYSNSTTHEDMIIDANAIKEDMKRDLLLFDHVSISVNSGVDIIDSIIEVGKAIFSVAQRHSLFFELLIEDVYDDVIQISPAHINIQKRGFCSIQNQEIVFSCNDNERLLIYNKKYQPIILSYDKNISSSQFMKLLKGDNLNNCFITELTECAPIYKTYDIKKGEHPVYYTIRCIEPISHRLFNFKEDQKCSHLHGHTYQFIFAIDNPFDSEIERTELLRLGVQAHNLLKKAFSIDVGIVTTVENVIDYVFSELKKEYNIIFAELSETPNIKVRIYQ